jgi:hypothetical protein
LLCSLHRLVLPPSFMLWLRHFLHTLAADNKDTRCCTGRFLNNVQLTGQCRSTHLGDKTHGILSMFPDPSRRTREPPSSDCISSRHSGSPVYFLRIQSCACPTLAYPRPCTPMAAPGTSRPAPHDRHFSGSGPLAGSWSASGLVLRLSIHFFLFYLPIAFSPQMGIRPGHKPSLLF